jgi:hypothetical protein
MTPRTHDRLPLLTDVCPDDAAVLALSVLRFVAAGFSTGDVTCWDTAFNGAERVLGPGRGPCCVAAMITLMRSIRAEYSGDLSFMPISCSRVTEHEQSVVELIELARAGRHRETRMKADRLACKAAPKTVAAVESAALLLNHVAPDLGSIGMAMSSRRAPDRRKGLH